MTPPEHVLITGATGGIGQALAMAYAAPGTHLTLTGRDELRLHEVEQACRKRGASVSTHALDVRDGEGLRDWVQAVDAAHPVTTAIANAGVNSSLGPDEEEEAIADVRRCFQVNTLGVVETMHALAERMRQRGTGRLAVVASLGGWCGMHSSPAYSASKAAAVVYGDAMRAWLAPHGVSVSVISPGFVDSPMSRRYLGNKPQVWSVTKAAHHIRRGIDQGRKEIAFPVVSAALLRLLMLFPAGLRDSIIRHQCTFTVVPDAESPRHEDP